MQRLGKDSSPVFRPAQFADRFAPGAVGEQLLLRLAHYDSLVHVSEVARSHGVQTGAMLCTGDSTGLDCHQQTLLDNSAFRASDRQARWPGVYRIQINRSTSRKAQHRWQESFRSPPCVVHASSQPSSRLRDQNLGELRYPHGSDCWVRYGSNNSGQNEGTNGNKGKDCNHLGSDDYSPEKAGVGGSTPSLATIIFNSLENPPKISHL
jgi:hypothetical protein